MAVKESMVSRDEVVFGHMIFGFPKDQNDFGQPLVLLEMLSPRQLLVNHEPEQLHCTLRAFQRVTTHGEHQVVYLSLILQEVFYCKPFL